MFSSKFKTFAYPKMFTWKEIITYSNPIDRVKCDYRSTTDYLYEGVAAAKPTGQVSGFCTSSVDGTDDTCSCGLFEDLIETCDFTEGQFIFIHKFQKSQIYNVLSGIA